MGNISTGSTFHALPDLRVNSVLFTAKGGEKCTLDVASQGLRKMVIQESAITILSGADLRALEYACKV